MGRGNRNMLKSTRGGGKNQRVHDKGELYQDMGEMSLRNKEESDEESSSGTSSSEGDDEKNY